MTEETGTPSYYSAVHDSVENRPGTESLFLPRRDGLGRRVRGTRLQKRDVVVAAIRDRGDPVRFPVDAAGRRVLWVKWEFAQR